LAGFDLESFFGCVHTPPPPHTHTHTHEHAPRAFLFFESDKKEFRERTHPLHCAMFMLRSGVNGCVSMLTVSFKTASVRGLRLSAIHRCHRFVGVGPGYEVRRPHIFYNAIDSKHTPSGILLLSSSRTVEENELMAVLLNAGYAVPPTFL
jgi:hypothetical protein